MSVCLSVTTLAKASLGSTPRKRYVQHWYRLFSVLSSKKPFRSKVMAQYANEYLLTATSSGADAATFHLNFRRQGFLWFFQSLTVGYTLPGILLVRQRAVAYPERVSPKICACA